MKNKLIASKKGLTNTINGLVYVTQILEYQADGQDWGYTEVHEMQFCYQFVC